MNKFIPLAIPNIGALEGEYLQKCVTDNFVSSVGPFVLELENKCARISGFAPDWPESEDNKKPSLNAVATGAGTLALHIALLALDIGEGDLVILPSFTFIASANSISHAGAEPWLIDINPNDWTIDPDKIEAELSAHSEMRDGICFHVPSGKRVAAIMPVYTLGTPADMVRIGEIAKKYNLKIIADAAAAIGVHSNQVNIGELADLTCYSFNGNKTITCGGGGMIVGKDKETIARAKHLTTTARSSFKSDRLNDFSADWVSQFYDHDEVGYNYRMTNLQAAVGCAQFERLNEFLAAKIRIREKYNAAFSNTNEVAPFPAPNDRTSTYWFSGIILNQGGPAKVGELCKTLAENKIEARPFWKPIHLQKPYANAPRGDMVNSENLWSKIVTLPCSTSLSDEDQDFVIAKTKKFLEGASF